jgi:1,4-alpha-glucan branching enzyme
MKNNNRKAKQHKLVPVPLQCPVVDATAVFVAGTFNEWNYETTPLERDGNGVWKGLLQLAPGRYEFRLVADGVWIDPPGASETVENAFGSKNAVLHVGNGERRRREPA